MMPGFDLPDWITAVVPTVLTAIGVVVVGQGVWSIVRARRFLRVAQRVTGVVSAHRHRVQQVQRSRRGPRRSRTITVPVLRFRTRTGQLVDAEQSLSLRRRVPDPGAEVDVLYDPADPRRAALVGSTNGVTPEAVGTIASGALLAIVGSNVMAPWLFRLL